MGRKIKSDGQKAKTLTFRGSDAEKKAIDVLAARSGVDTAEFVRAALMAQHGAKISEVALMLETVVP